MYLIKEIFYTFHAIFYVELMMPAFYFYLLMFMILVSKYMGTVSTTLLKRTKNVIFFLLGSKDITGHTLRLLVHCCEIKTGDFQK